MGKLIIAKFKEDLEQQIGIPLKKIPISSTLTIKVLQDLFFLVNLL